MIDQLGSTENAGQRMIKGWKLRDRTMKDQMSGPENTGLYFGGPYCTGGK